MTTTCDQWQTTFFFNIHANFKTGSHSDPEVSVSVPLGKSLPSDEALRAATATATADLAGALRSAIDEAITSNNTSDPPLLGTNDWKTVWGPQVFCVGPQTIIVPEASGGDYIAEFNATNAMYVVHSARLGRYIVAIAATNTPSIFDWIVEDADAARVVAWEMALRVWNDGIATDAATAAIAAKTTTDTQSAPYISHATFAGITILLNLVDTVITKKTLVDFLKGLTLPSGTTITFTGHSLAGALSPTLAMACFVPDVGLLKDSAWRVSNAMVYPTAGATPGNAPFARLFDGAGWGGADGKKELPWQVWNRNLYNNLDIVPHAWGKNMMDRITNLYLTVYAQPKEALDIKAVIETGRSIASIGENVAGAYTPINNQPLNSIEKSDTKNEFFYEYGKDKYFTPPQASAAGLAPASKTKIPWTTQATLQHTIAYGSLLEIPEALLMSNNSTV